MPKREPKRKPKQEKTTGEEVPHTIRFPGDIHRQAVERAKAEDRSFNRAIVLATRAWLEGKGEASHQ